MFYVKELRRYAVLMAAFYRAAESAQRLNDVDFDRACEYDDVCENLWDKAEAVKKAIRAHVHSMPKGEKRATERKICRLAQRLTGIKL